MNPTTRRSASGWKGLFTFFVLAILAGVPSSAVEGAAAKLTKLEGKVEVKAPGGTTWAAAVEGMAVAEGVSVRTGADGKAFIAWKTGHTVKVHPLSNITIEKLGSVGGAENNSISLTSGKAYARAQKLSAGSTFTVKTPTAVAGVRGSGWETALLANGSTSVSVVEGSITVEGGGVELVVDMNFKTSVSSDPGAAPEEPAAIPPADIESLQQDNEESAEVSAEEASVEEGGTEKKEEAKPAEEELKEEEKADVEEKIEGEGAAVEQEAPATDVADITDAVTQDALEQVVDDVINKQIENDNLNEIIQEGTIELNIR